MDAPLTPGTDHRTEVEMAPGAPHSDEASTLDLQFPEGTTGSLHVVYDDNTVYNQGIWKYGYASIYHAPEGESFDPDDTSNATKVTSIEFLKLSGKFPDGYPFRDFSDVLTGNVPIGSVTPAA